MTMVIDEGDFDPGETTYLIAKSAPNEKKSESPDRNMFATAKVYFKRVAPFIYVAVLSYIAGGMKSKPSVAEVPIVDIANLEPLRSSSKIPAQQGTPQESEDEEQSSCYDEDMEDEEIERQLKDMIDGPELAFNISVQIAELIRTSDSIDMEMIMNQVNDTLNLGNHDDFYELLDSVFLQAPDLMEDLSELFEDENHTDVYVARTKKPTVLSEIKNFTVGYGGMVNITSEIVDHIVTVGIDVNNTTEAPLEDTSSVRAWTFDSKKAEVPNIDSLMRTFLDLPVEASIQSKASADINLDDLFKDVPESFHVIENSVASMTRARLSQIEKFQRERTEMIQDNVTSSAPSSAPYSKSKSRLRYLSASADGKDTLASKLEQIDTAQHPKKKFDVQPISNTRKLLDLANNHISLESSKQLRSLSENNFGLDSCSGEAAGSLSCRGIGLVNAARKLDDIFCQLSTLMTPVDTVMNNFKDARGSISNTALLSKIVILGLTIGTALPYGIGSFLGGVYRVLDPIEKIMISRVDKTAKLAFDRVVKPWDATVGVVLDKIDDATLSMRTHSSLIATVGGFKDDGSACLSDIVLSVLRQIGGKAVGELEKFHGKLVDLATKVTEVTTKIYEALQTLLDVLKTEVWKAMMGLLENIVNVGEVLWGIFSPLERLAAVFEQKVNIPWFQMPYDKTDLGSAKCPHAWERDTLKRNCYKPCPRGFEKVPNLVEWKCRPRCSLMGTKMGVGGCLNKRYKRSTKYPHWRRGCGGDWDTTPNIPPCLKKCNSGYRATPFSAARCHKTSCPAHFSARTNARYCARNSSNRERTGTRCDSYKADVPAGRGLKRDALGKCRVQCKNGDFDGGQLGCFPPARLSISIKDIADELDKIMEAIMDLPIVRTIESGIKELVGPILEEFKAIANTVLDRVLGFSLDFLDGLKIRNPLEDFKLQLPSPILPELPWDLLQEPIDELRERILNNIPEFLQKLIQCNQEEEYAICIFDSLGLDIDIGLFHRIINSAQELNDTVKDMLEVLDRCAYQNIDPNGSKSITTAIFELIKVEPPADGAGSCELVLPLPACGAKELNSLGRSVKKIFDIVTEDLLQVRSSRVSIANIPEVMMSILSIDILRPKDTEFIASGVQRLLPIPKSVEKGKDIYDILSYEKIPSTKLNVYMRMNAEDLKWPVVEYESSIEWKVFYRPNIDTRSLLNIAVASLKVFLWKDMYWDLQDWCYDMDMTNMNYTQTPFLLLKTQCAPIYAIEAKIEGTGCRSTTCNVPLMEDLLREHSELSTYWDDDNNAESAAKCALHLSDLFNQAVDAKSTFVGATRLTNNWWIIRDARKIVSIPLSFAKSNDEKYFDGSNHYHLGIGQRSSTELSDLSGDLKGMYDLGVGNVQMALAPDESMKIGFNGLSVIFSATKTVFNSETMPLEPTQSPAPTPNSAQKPNVPPTPSTPGNLPPAPTCLRKKEKCGSLGRNCRRCCNGSKSGYCL